MMRLAMAQKYFRGQLYLDRGGIEGTVLLAGCGRSGTTWLAELLASTGSFRVMFEPFSPKHVRPAARACPVRSYIAPGNTGGACAKYVERVLAGRIRHPWVDRYNRVSIVERRLVKTIRANFMLKWVRDSFPSIPIVMLVRNPVAIAFSRQRGGWHCEVEKIVAQPQFPVWARKASERALGLNNTPLLRQLVLTCLEIAVPIRELQGEDICLVFYEDLRDDFEPSLRRVLDHVGIPWSGEFLNKRHLPSKMTRKNQCGDRVVDSSGEYHGQISRGEWHAIRVVLEMFGMDRIYDIDGRPHTQKR